MILQVALWEMALLSNSEEVTVGGLSPQDQDLLSPGIIVNCGSASPNLEGSRHLSRSNIDIPRSASSASSSDEPKRQLPRKKSDSSTYEVDTIKQHHAFLSRCVSDRCVWNVRYKQQALV